jgi:hypothetical protein
LLRLACYLQLGLRSELIIRPPNRVVDAKAEAKSRLNARIRYFREMLNDLFWSTSHANLKTLLDMYENGRLSPVKPEIIYIQDGVVYDNPAPRIYGLPT